MVKDGPRSRAFFEKYLGFRRAFTHGDGVNFRRELTEDDDRAFFFVYEPSECKVEVYWDRIR